MVRKEAFPHTPANSVNLLPHHSGRAHQRVNEAMVWKALIEQLQKKVPGPDRQNFRSLSLL